jgi:hypothetical protein
VELARVLKKREDKRTATTENSSSASAPAPSKPKASDGKEGGSDKGKRSYRQREVVDRAHGLKATGMDSVLGNIFG